MIKNKVLLKCGNKDIIIDLNDIIYCRAKRNYSEIFLCSNNNPIVCSKTLKNIEAFLPNEIFVRCHKSIIVNIDCIKYLHLEDQKVGLKSNFEVDLSKNGYKRLKSHFILVNSETV